MTDEFRGGAFGDETDRLFAAAAEPAAAAKKGPWEIRNDERFFQLGMPGPAGEWEPEFFYPSRARAFAHMSALNLAAAARDAVTAGRAEAVRRFDSQAEDAACAEAAAYDAAYDDCHEEIRAVSDRAAAAAADSEFVSPAHDPAAADPAAAAAAEPAGRPVMMTREGGPYAGPAAAAAQALDPYPAFESGLLITVDLVGRLREILKAGSPYEGFPAERSWRRVGGLSRLNVTLADAISQLEEVMR